MPAGSGVGVGTGFAGATGLPPATASATPRQHGDGSGRRHRATVLMHTPPRRFRSPAAGASDATGNGAAGVNGTGTTSAT